MTAIQKTLAYRSPAQNGDSWLFMTRDRVIFIDTRLSDLAIEHKAVSVIGRMGIPQGSPFTKLSVE